MIKYNKTLHEKVDEFLTINGIKPPQCISDRILLYIKYILDKIRKRERESIFSWQELGTYRAMGGLAFRTQEEMDVAHLVYEEQVMRIYYEVIRSNMKYTNRNPVIVAAACCWVGSKMLSDGDKIFITQSDVMSIVHTESYRGNETALRTMSRIIEEDIKNLAHSIRF